MIVARCANQFVITFRRADKGAVFTPRRVVLGFARTKEAKCGNAGCCGHVHQSRIIAHEECAPSEIAAYGRQVTDAHKIEHRSSGSRQDRIGLVPLAGGGKYGDLGRLGRTVIGDEALCESREAITAPPCRPNLPRDLWPRWAVSANSANIIGHSAGGIGAATWYGRRREFYPMHLAGVWE